MEKKRIMAVLVDVKNKAFGAVNIPDELDVFYALLGCRCIDIVTRRIGGQQKAFEIICDDEFLLADSPKISAVDGRGGVQLCGNILIAGPADAEGDLTSLDEDDAASILSCIQLMRTRLYREPYPILTQCEYA